MSNLLALALFAIVVAILVQRNRLKEAGKPYDLKDAALAVGVIVVAALEALKGMIL